MHTLDTLPGFGQKCGDPFFCSVCERQAYKAGLLREYLAEQDRLATIPDEDDDDESCTATHSLPDWMGDV